MAENMKTGSHTWKDIIVHGAAQSGIAVQPYQADQFAVHAGLLKEWNQKINLTAIDEPVEVAVKHFLDAIIPSRYIKPDSRLLDVGSGAGFPGIAIKVMIPTIEVTLVEATRKKVSFLKHVIRELHLNGISAIQSRIENLPPQAGSGFDVIVSRAFSNLSEFVEKSLPYLARGGLLMAYKGRGFTEETLDVQATPGTHKPSLISIKNIDRRFQMTIVHFKLPFLELNRSLILLQSQNISV
jgi:16S rRNA (guanine527-N7)-methyltransferase